MRRRLVSACVIAAAVAGVAVSAAGPAAASEGWLYLNNGWIKNPSGCYNLDRPGATVDNQTDSTARVYWGADCQGSVTDEIRSGEGADAAGLSVYVP